MASGPVVAPASASPSAARSSRRTADTSRGRIARAAAPTFGSRFRRASLRVCPRAMADARPDPSIVVIDDEPQIRRFLRAALAGQGYRVYEASTGADALVEVASRQPDVVILDLGLPDMDGIEVIRKVREWSAVPVIVLSARGQESDKVAALDAGADDYLSKPFSVGELMARMRVA